MRLRFPNNLKREFASDLNRGIDIPSLSGGSGLSVWWRCKIGHEWKAKVTQRFRGSKCPYCAGKKPTAENCLQSLHPEVSKEWHPTKNGNLKPSSVLPYSSIIIWWKCQNGHEWQAKVFSRSNGTTCPICLRNSLISANPYSTKGKVVSDIPQLLAEWHHDRNAGIDPRLTVAGSNKKVWWKCSQGHEFFMSPNSRTNNRRKTGGISRCSICIKSQGGYSFWTWKRIVKKANDIVKQCGYLPPAEELRRMGYSSMAAVLYERGKTWEDLRAVVNDFNRSSFVQSRSGLRWRSHPEASLSNFLFSRGIKHGKGKKYPEEYTSFSGRNYGYYDLWFLDKNNRLIDVEVWGDKPLGFKEEHYKYKRKIKEEFNKGRNTFLGLHYTDCYSEALLSKKLEPFIGDIYPFNFVKPYDRQIETTHWSNADDLLITCKKIADMQPDGKFPTEDWLRKRGKWFNREGEAYNTVSVYIKLWVGGTRKVRELLGQSEFSTIKWDKEKALLELTTWYRQYGKSPNAIRMDARCGKINLSKDESDRGSRIIGAVEKHAGGMIAACKAIGIKPSRNYTHK